MNKIVIRGAREHNLKNLSLEIPRDKLVVITGLSGSGKSSLAFDTIYAEGQRRYVESLSAYARQFLEQMSKPDVDSIEGLSPAISIEQKTTSKNPRSTVGTVTEIYDYLRLLFARIGKPHCYKCGKEITTQTVQQMVDHIMALGEGTRINILAPIVRGRKGEYRKELNALRKDGFVRVRVDGEVKSLDEKITLDKKRKHTIEAFVDRLQVKKDKVERRLADSLETALKLAGGLVKIDLHGTDDEITFSENFACPDCGVSYPEISPRFFSFNNPHGACTDCGGLGSTMNFDPELVIPNENLSLRSGVIAPWERRGSAFFMQTLRSLAEHYDFDLDIPWKRLPNKVKDMLLNGSRKQNISFEYSGMDGKHVVVRPFEGIIPNLDRRYRETESDWAREDIGRFMNLRRCPKCDGGRLKEEALHVLIGGLNIYDITRMSVKESLQFFSNVKLSKRDMVIARRIFKEIKERLSFMVNVGLDYLTLDRTSGTISGGEGQRIRLATQIGSSLVGVLYILDEPSIGLHQRDNKRLLETLKRLRDLGNTIIIVEHDEETILSADHIVDMGPGAGVHGGEIVFQGPPNKILKSEKSLTGKYISGKMSIPLPKKRRKPGRWIEIKGARANNLKDITVKFPLGLFTCVTGVSGSGKSTLVVDTLYKALGQRLYRSRERAGEIKDLIGYQQIDKVIDIDQSPIGRTPRSNPATYTGLFTPIRDLFTKLPEARMRGYAPGRFSFNVKGGRCEACEGDGLIKIEMHFLPDIFVMCDVCKGLRYNRETLEVRYKGMSIADILDMTVEEGLDFLKNIPAIRSKLETLRDVGLDYIKLGQSATTLSGGEAQRIKLSKELSKRSTGKTLYILDEPTTGLHFHDIKKLLEVLHRLVSSGNTVIVIEHNLDVIKTADYIVDLGPEGGDRGGEVVAAGKPEEIVKVKASHTAKFLKKVLTAKGQGKPKKSAKVSSK